MFFFYQYPVIAESKNMQNCGKIAAKMHEIVKPLQNRKFTHDFEGLYAIFDTGQF